MTTKRSHSDSRDLWQLGTTVLALLLFTGCGLKVHRPEVRLKMPGIENGRATGKQVIVEIELPRENESVPYGVSTTIKCLGESKTSSEHFVNHYASVLTKAETPSGRKKVTLYRVLINSQNILQHAPEKDGVLRGQFEFDPLDFKKGIDAELREIAPDEAWTVKSALIFFLDNTSLFRERKHREILRSNPRMLCIKADTLVEWMSWTLPE